MAGELSVASTPGEGSTFTVRLPAAEPAAVARPSAAAARRAIATPEAVVLYIEDNDSNIQLMRHVVGAIGGLTLHVADHPVAGLEAARRLRPDVILLDINLPDMDGFEVKVRLEAHPATRAIPVVALSANALSETRVRGGDAGFHSYLTKPLNLEALMAAIGAALAARPAQPARRRAPRRAKT
jgi:CheY-like chemotaxis protein